MSTLQNLSLSRLAQSPSFLQEGLATATIFADIAAAGTVKLRGTCLGAGNALLIVTGGHTVVALGTVEMLLTSAGATFDTATIGACLGGSAVIF